MFVPHLHSKLRSVTSGAAKKSRTTLRGLVTGVLLTTLALPGAVAHAAVQGTADNVASSGSLDINATLGILTRISGLRDLPLGTWSGSGPLTGNENICIGRTGTSFFTGAYRIRASGDGEPGDPSAFTLSNGAQTLKYNAFFNDAANAGAGRAPLTGGVTLRNQSSFGLFLSLNVSRCAVNNANISVEVPESELQGANGAYEGTLTLLLTPE